MHNIKEAEGGNRLIELGSVVITVMLLGIVVHGPRLVGSFLGYDSLFYYRPDDAAWQLALGRFGEPLYRLVTGNQIALPWASTLLTLLWCGVATYLASDVLGIQRPLLRISVGLLFLTCEPITVALAAYTAFADGQAFSMTLAAFAVWAWRYDDFGHDKARAAASVAALAISLSIYQSYLCFYAGLVVACAFADSLDGKDAAYVARKTARSILIAVTACVAYYCLLRLCNRLSGVALYDGPNGLAQIGRAGLVEYLQLVLTAWVRPIEFLLVPNEFNIALVVAANVLLLGFVTWKTILLCRGRPTSAAICLLLLLVFPLIVNLVFVISNGQTYELMETAFVLLYAPAILVLDRIWHEEGTATSSINKAIGPVVVALLAIVVWNGTVFAHGLYGLREYDYQGTTATINRVIYRMESTEGYEPGSTPIYLVGTLEESPLGQNLPDAFERYAGMAYDRSHAAGLSVSHQLQYGPMISTALDYPADLHYSTREPDFISQQAWATVDEMEPYPSQGSCRMVDGVMVVKLS